MADWYVNPGLAVLIRQIKAIWVGIVIYTIGDTDHQSRKSDHNPNSAGRVNAADFMLRGPFTRALARILVAWLIRDPRTKYVIFEKRIWQDGKWRDFGGDDPHNDHVHLSVFDSAYKNTNPWKVKEMNHTYQSIDGFSLPVLKYGMSDAEYSGWNHIFRLQRILGIEADGEYGPATANAVKDWMGKGDGKTVDRDEWISIYGLSRQ